MEIAKLLADELGKELLGKLVSPVGRSGAQDEAAAPEVVAGKEMNLFGKGGVLGLSWKRAHRLLSLRTRCLRGVEAEREEVSRGFPRAPTRSSSIGSMAVVCFPPSGNRFGSAGFKKREGRSRP